MERLHFHFSLSCTGEGNGNPLQCSCLENPRDGGAWWAAVYGVAQSRTQLKRLSSSSNSPSMFSLPSGTSASMHPCPSKNHHTEHSMQWNRAPTWGPENWSLLQACDTWSLPILPSVKQIRKLKHRDEIRLAQGPTEKKVKAKVA